MYFSHKRKSVLLRLAKFVLNFVAAVIVIVLLAKTVIKRRVLFPCVTNITALGS